MASIACSLQHPRCNFTFVSNTNINKGIAKLRRHSAVPGKNNEQQLSFGIQEEDGATRRQTLLGIGIGMTMPLVLPIISDDASAETEVSEGFRIYTDDVNKFKIMIPKEWQVGAGEPNGFKSITAFFPRENSSSNVSVVITGLGPDFTKIESFGKVDEFAETLVSGLDRSWQRPPGVAAKLLNSKASKGFYYIEYSLTSPGESSRHLFSALGMANNGWYNRLYTITGQFPEEESDTYGKKIEQAVTSFRFI
ncbi:hypothetical protein UlMin_033878 [Ulmus minor]